MIAAVTGVFLGERVGSKVMNYWFGEEGEPWVSINGWILGATRETKYHVISPCQILYFDRNNGITEPDDNVRSPGLSCGYMVHIQAYPHKTKAPLSSFKKF